MTSPDDSLRALMGQAPDLCMIMGVLEDAGHAAHLVGGAVRDAIMGRPVKDLDVSTSARPHDVADLFQRKGFEVVPTGIDHGTLTVVVGGEGYEITTWRRDVACDGRRAVIAVADRLEDDAIRRDFTFNALYADLRGHVLDPTGLGVQDALDQKVRFVGDATARIQEDALRILRFCRFHAVLGLPITAGEGADACRQQQAFLQDLSHERIGAEFLKIASAPRPGPVLSWMMETGVWEECLPDERPDPGGVEEKLDRMDRFMKEIGHDSRLEPRLALLLTRDQKDALRISKRISSKAVILRTAALSETSALELGYRHGLEDGRDILALRAALQGWGHLPSEVLADLDLGAKHSGRFPVRAKDLDGSFTGRAIGQELKRQEREWLDARFDDQVLGGSSGNRMHPF